MTDDRLDIFMKNANDALRAQTMLCAMALTLNSIPVRMRTEDVSERLKALADDWREDRPAGANVFDFARSLLIGKDEFNPVDLTAMLVRGDPEERN